jgi:glycerol-3-phosphate O-acyltransferase
VFFVPATINYLLTLEAETLIADYLAEAGAAATSSRTTSHAHRAHVTLVRKLLAMTTGSVVIRFGEPMDPFGNRVDDDGRSVDRRGRTVDPATYVTRDGQP